MKRAGYAQVQLVATVGKRVASHNAHSAHTGTEIVTHVLGAKEDLKIV
jgi:hypothetical protein